MESEIDRLAKMLASGASRREALGAVVAGGAALLPWTAAGKDEKERRRQRRRIIRRTLEFCQFWCDEKFTGNEAAIQSCFNAAKTGKGPCYSASEQGPGHFCLRIKKCGDGKYCCPESPSGGPVTEGACCPRGTFCAFINGTVVGELCVA